MSRISKDFSVLSKPPQQKVAPVMCDSEFSETCQLDFSSYMPTNASEIRVKPKSCRVKSSSHHSRSRRSSVPRKYSTESNLLRDMALRSDLDGLLSNNFNRYSFDSDDDCESLMERARPSYTRGHEFPNRYVSQEELDALKGCVMRRRVIFSPSPSSSPVSHNTRHKNCSQHFPEHSNSLPARGKRILLNNECKHKRHGSFEYDHLRDFDPHTDTASTGNMSDSVSVQFRLQVKEESEVPHDSVSQYSRTTRTPFSGYNMPDLLSTEARFDIGACPVKHAPSSTSFSEPCRMKHVQECSTDAHVVLPSKLCGYRSNLELTTPENTMDLFPRPVTKSTSVQHYSPYHTKFNSPLLSKHHHDESVRGLKTCDHTGSNFSIYSQATTVSSLNDRPHCTYSKGVDGNRFKDRTDKVMEWFSEFSDQQRNMMLMSLLEHCDCAQMHFLSMRMEPILHDGCPHNCQDLLSWLPFTVVTHIFSFLDPVSLCLSSAVNKDWYHAAIQPMLWEKFCKLEKWRISTSGELKYLSKFSNLDGSILWKDMFGEKYRLRRNWLKGYCNVRTFAGHTQGISCIQFDDTRIVSGSWDKTIKVWNRRTNTVWAALTLAGHSGTVRCLHLHNNRLVSGSSDRTIKVWDLATDKVGWVGAACRATMVGHMHTVRCLQADNEKVISGSYDQTLKIWDVKTGRCRRTLRGHTDAVLCLQFDHYKVVSGSKDKTIKIWSLPQGVCKLTFEGHQAAVSCLHFDEMRIISGALDRLIKIWNMVTGECIRSIDWIKSEGHTGVVRHLQADSWKIISAADDKTLKVWNVHTGNRLLTLKSHTDGVTCLQFNDEIIVSGSYDKTVKLWDFSVC